MAYAYPSGGDANASSASLVHSSPVKSTASTRKGSDDKFDVLREFKAKIEEDNNYIQFFQDRIKVEEEYIAGLKRVYSRSKAIDSLHDDVFRRDEKPTSRKAWDEVRDYTTREIQAKEALVGALKEAVVKELVRLKEEQARIRMGLKENMKLANERYDDHAKNQLPRLKRAYFQRSQALEDHRRQEHAIEMQAKLLADSPTSPSGAPLREHPNAYTFTSGTTYPLSPPASTSALPPASNPATAQFELLAQREDRKGATGRLRAGSASGQGQAKEVLSDIAQQSKKGFNAIMQKLGGDKGDREESGFVVVGRDDAEQGGAAGLQRKGTTARGDPTRGMGTMRGVRVKREAEDADKAYRLGVFHLESLRLRRDKLQTSAVRNLESFSDDLNKTLMSALEVYMDTMHGTAATVAQATHVPRRAIEEVNLDKDMSLYRARLRAVDSQRTAPVPYHNFYVGECRSLIFGVSLTDYDFARGEGSDHGRPPTIVEKCISAIDEKGLDAEGIYRISGRHAGVQKLIQGIELDEEKFHFDEKDDVYSISNVLKQYLRELPEPVFHFPQAERMKYTDNRETHIHSNFSVLRGRLRRLPPIHQTTFQAIVEHLSRVAAHSASNKMDAKNLAVVFNSVLFGQEHVGPETDLLSMSAGKDSVLEDLITYSDLLFGADDNGPAPAIFPPGSALSRSGVLAPPAFEDSLHPGTSRTKFRMISPDTEKPDPVTENAAALIDDNAAGPSAVPASDATPEATRPSPTTIAPPSYTQDKQLDLLFEPSAIPQSMRDGIGSDYHVRPLASTDLMRSHFGLLQTLTEAPPIAPSIYAALFAHLKACPDTYYIVVVVDKKTDQLVAHGTVLVEKKYIHGGSSAAHIEDIVVSPFVRRGGMGKKLVVGLRDLAVRVGCYKVILHCKEDKIPFYEKCGFEARSTGMAYYVTSDKKAEVDDLETSHATVPPPSSGEARGGNLLSINTGPPLVIDLNSTEGGESTIGSPKTYNSGSSSSGVTYSFPIQPGSQTQAPPASEHFPATGSTGNVPPVLPPRPLPSRQTSDTHFPGPVTATSIAASLLSPSGHSASLSPDRDLEAKGGADGTALGDRVVSPTALEETPDAPDTPAWAAEGLGSSEKNTLLPVSSSIGSLNDQLGAGPTLGSVIPNEAEKEGTASPLPPGAAPASRDEEPERIVPSRG